MRRVLEAIFYVLKTGYQWVMLSKDYPNHNSVYYYFQKWSNKGVWERINTVLCEQVRVIAGRQAHPSAASIDSQDHGGRW